MASKTSSVVVLVTATGEKLFIRANPTDAAVREAVKIQTERHLQGEFAGPGQDHPAFKIYNAFRYETEDGYYAGDEPVAEIDITKVNRTP